MQRRIKETRKASRASVIWFNVLNIHEGGKLKYGQING